ncbi:toxin-antitoxin system YwqK family antitoxin [Spirosoma fluviale]|uniref:MORN repeat variant n=1 Tax=Spirosoma fluviale TaxID=1597977 RepID=A0A286FYG3_9BACT|nr:membrane-binding protein [Spirosoma fluviale]SOD88056.1 MORN repeat variant [Spirosoma fluviale]
MAADIMAKPVQLLSKLWLIAFLLPVFFSCTQTASTGTIPLKYVSTDQPGWQKREGKLWMHDTLFSGWYYELSPTGDTAFVGAYDQGRAEGPHRHWYSNHQLKEIRQYKKGWQEGEQRGWYESGKPAFVYEFKNDVYEGRRQEWYANGQPAQDGHYHDGRESGAQRMWYADGSLKVNYVARNGRNYGFTGVKNCVNVWDSISLSH